MGQIIVNIIVFALLLFNISLASHLIYSTNKFISVSIAAIFTISSYIVFFISIRFEQDLLISIFISLLAAVSLMLLINEIIYKKFKSLDFLSWKITIASLGAYIILQNIISIIWGDNILSIRNWPIQTGNKIFNIYISNLDIITIFICIAIITFTYLFLTKFSLGKKLKAIADNKELSNIFGIHVERVSQFSYVLAALIASITGILVALDTNMSPNMGFNWLLYGVIAMMIGGMGRIKDLFFGSLLLSSAQNFTVYYFSIKWMDATAFIILIIFLAWKPYGFSGKKLRKAEI